MSVTVGEFYDAGRESLQLDIESGEKHFNSVIHEKALNRPGLALAGFYQYFSNRRVQVVGLAESAYLKSLSPELRAERLHELFHGHIPCVILTRNRRALPEMLAAARKCKVPVLRTPLITSRFINAATLIMERLVAPRMRYQGTMVDVFGIGVLLEGGAGVGKSETALALIERGHSLVADDITVLSKDSNDNIIGAAVDITRYHMEIRGLGIVHIPSLFGVAAMRREMRLDMIIRLHEWNPAIEDDRTGLAEETREVMGIQVPFISLPVAAGRDMAHVVEVAALNQKLKFLGHDAAKELDERLVNILTRKRRA